MENTEKKLVWEGDHLYAVTGMRKRLVGSVQRGSFGGSESWDVYRNGSLKHSFTVEQSARERLENYAK